METHVKHSILALFIALFIVIPCCAEETNRNEERAKLSSGGWNVVYGDLLNEADAIEFAAAVALAASTESFTPIEKFFDYQFQVQVDKIRSTAPDIAQEALIDLLIRSFNSNGRILQHGRLEVSAGIVTYRRWERVVYDEPQTTQCKQSLPFGGWTWVPCVEMVRKERIVPYPNNHQPYFRFRWASSETGGSSIVPMASSSGLTGHKFYFINNCNKPVKLTLRWRMPSGEWVTDGVWQFDPNKGNYLDSSSGETVVSNNRVFYFYVESTDRSSIWSGVEYRDFKGKSIPMRVIELDLDSDGDYVLSITCN